MNLYCYQCSSPSHTVGSCIFVDVSYLSINTTIMSTRFEIMLVLLAHEFLGGIGRQKRR